jgi:hypothetical protein
MSSIRATVTASSCETRILVQDPIGDVLLARLGPLEFAHRYALRMLLEGIALWEQQTADVVLFADDSFDWHRVGLFDALGVARETALLKVDLAPIEASPLRRATRLTGLGSFARERGQLRAGRM